jgi:ribosome-associated heat shock protein Hsp15
MSPAADDGAHDPPGARTLRLDKWLWFARVAKSRTLAATLVSNGKVRLNRERIDKPAQTVRVGDVVTATVGRQVRVLRVVALGSRRGPAAEARCLFEELTEPANPPNAPQPKAVAEKPGAAQTVLAVRAPGTGRPTKRDRRAIDRFNSER